MVEIMAHHLCPNLTLSVVVHTGFTSTNYKDVRTAGDVLLQVQIRRKTDMQLNISI